jgi:hypothetical protein
MADTTTEAFDLKKNGTVFLRWEGQQEGSIQERTLRRPTLGQYRAFVELLGELSERGEGEEASLGSGLQATVNWLRIIFNGDEGRGVRGLSDRPLPDDDEELPAWLVSGDVARDLILHWQTSPTRPQ